VGISPKLQLDAFVKKMNWLYFEVRVSDEIKCGQKSSLRILKVMRSNTRVTDHLSGNVILVDTLPLKTISF